jgi:hypothetical protein
MDVDGALARSGLRPIDVRVLGWTAIIGIVITAAAGSAAPTITTGTADDIWSVDATVGPTELRVVAVFLASITIGFVLVTRFAEHRWPWPIGVRIKRPAGTRPNRAGVLAIIVSGLGSGALLPFLPKASELYGELGPTEPWVRVVAPLDFAAALIAFVLVFVLAFAAGVAINAAWGNRSAASDPSVPPSPP